MRRCSTTDYDFTGALLTLTLAMIAPTLAVDSGRIVRLAKLQIDLAQLEKTSKPPLSVRQDRE